MNKKFLTHLKKTLVVAVAATWLFSPAVMTEQNHVAYAAETQAAVSQSVLANTENGQVRGFMANGISYYRGIPYAKPPVGELRWRPPVR